jgi:alpha-beta hydrolase superfamily lysophospholipase
MSMDEGKYFLTRRGFYMYVKTWKPATATPKGVVIISHGFGEHLERSGYATLAAQLNSAGYIVTGMEHQGHGRSSGITGYIPNFNEHYEDLIEFVDSRRVIYRDLRMFLWAHSMVRTKRHFHSTFHYIR